MEKNNWRSGGQILDESAAQGGMDGGGGGDWRSQLQPDSRQRIVNKIMDTLKRHLPLSGQEGLQELQKIAVRFEEKIHMAATSQSDYLRKISLKMLAMENKSHNPMPNTTSTIPQDPASQTMHSQLQTLPIPMSSNQPQVRQQLLSQNIINNSPSTGAPNSSSLSSGLGLPPGGMPNVAGQNPNMPNTQEVSNMAPNSLGNSVGQGVPSNMFASSQRQITGRQQQVVHPEQQQYMYNQQVQHQLMKQKVQQGSMSHSLMQSQIQQQQQQQPQQQQQQQQNLLQATQLQSSQHAVMQPSLRQSSASSTLQQNQHSSLQQSTQSMLQQQSQSVLRQQPQQPSVMHQQQVLPTQQQHLSGQQQNTENMQHNQLIGQQNNILDAQRQQQQQQRLMAQQNSISNLQQQQQQPSIQQNNLPDMHQQQSTGSQNNFPNTHQQQLGLQNNVSGFQQQQMVGTQHVNPGLQNNQPPVMLQQPKITAQQQMQQNRANMLPGQAQQSQSRLPQQQLMSQIQSQPGQMQQQVGLQQAPNPIQRDMQQRIQTPGSLLQQQLTVDQPKQLLQSQGVLSELPLDSSSNSGNANSGDWQEEVYQKIKSMSEMYFSELNEMYQRMTSKLQQHDSLPQQPKNEQLEKLRFFKVLLERLMIFLRTNKNEIQPNHKEKMLAVEKQILSIINSNKPRKPVSSLQQGQVAQSQMHTMQQSQQLQRQVSPMNNNENQMSSQMQPMNVQGSQIQNNLTNLQPNSISSLSNVSNSRQNMMDAMHPNSNIDPGHGNAMNSIRQVAMSSIQQNPVGGPQQMNSSSISSQGGLTSLQSNVNPVQASTNLLQSQHVKQEQPMFTTQQMKQQYQQRHMQQQHIHRQQLMQQQHQQHHMTPQKSSQLPAQQMVTNDTDMKMRSQISGKPGVLQQHHSSGQRPSYQQMKTGPPFSISSPQVLQASSPQFGHHPSPQLDHQNMLISHAKGGTPLQSANSPFIVPSPSTSMAPSPMPGDSEKINSGISSLVNAGNNVHHSSTGASMSAQSMAIGTPGISASPLLAEFTSPEGTHGIASTIVSGNPKVAEEPLERLTKVVKSMTPKALSAAVSDISSVVSMVDRIAGSAPGNGSRAAVGEDLVAMTKCRLQARNFFTQDGSGGSKKMRRYTSAVPSTVASSTGSVDDSPWHLNGFESDGESTGGSSIKKPRIEANHALEEELRELNQRLIDTIVHISEDDIDPTAVTAATEGGDGTIVKCTFTAVALSPNLKSHYASAQMSPIQPLRLLIPSNYPKCSPILLDKFPVEVSKEYEDLSLKAKSRLSISLRSLSEPMSLGEIAKTWDVCARAVILEYAQQRGGGSFSSKYGTWENCLSAA